MKPQLEELLLQFGDVYGTMLTRIWKPAKSRGTVFCIHSFEGNGSDFDYLARHLVQQNFTVVCPDIIGRGKSTFFGDPARYSFDAYLVCIGALSKFASGEKNYFIATSWGGTIAMFFLYLTRVKVDKMILNDVGFRGGAIIDSVLAWLREDASREFESLEDAHAYVRRSRDFLGEFPEGLWPNYLANKVRFADGKYRLAYDPTAIPQVEANPGQYDLFQVLEKIDTKVLLLFGDGSKLYDEAAIADLLGKRPEFSCIAGLRAGPRPSLMTYEQALLISGYLSS